MYRCCDIGVGVARTLVISLIIATVVCYGVLGVYCSIVFAIVTVHREYFFAPDTICHVSSCACNLMLLQTQICGA